MSYLIYLTIKFLFLFVSYINSCKWSPTQCGCAKTAPSIHNRIVGGTIATQHSWPWLVSIRQYGGHICGGTLINNRYVLTAAHCFKDYYPSMISAFTFAMGHHGLMEKYFVSNAKRIILHKSYDSNGRNIHDIALIELSKTVDFKDPRLGFICLPLKHMNDNGAFPPIGTSTWVIGWGTTRYEGYASNVLMQVSVPITDNRGCIQKVTDKTKQVCAGFDKGGKDSCQGDSGGPLMIDSGKGIFELVGIVSFGVGCALYLEPGIYTRASAYINWINESMNPVQPISSLDAISHSISSNNINPDSSGSNEASLSVQALMSSKEDYRNISYLLLFIEILFLI